MIPVIAIIGRPNVGKSTLFNRITRTRNALVLDTPGVTRDRQYAQAFHHNKRFVLIDTGGIGVAENDIDALLSEQTQLALQEADSILFIVDAKDGLTSADEAIANQLRKIDKPVHLIVNKIDRDDPDIAVSEFHSLGLTIPFGISAVHGRGIDPLLHQVLEPFSETSSDIDPEKAPGIKIAVVGRPNVGKSTLINRMLGEERVIAFDQPGTTRDSIFIPMERNGQQYTLIDTAGVRRRGRIDDALEKFSVVKTLQAIDTADVVIMMMDATEAITEQDLKLLGFILEVGRALVIAVNKWDGLATDQREYITNELDRRLTFVSYAKRLTISARHGTGVGDLFKWVRQAYDSASQSLSTPKLTRILEKCVQQHQPPLVHGRRIKLRYAHAGGRLPPIIVIHGNQVNSLPASYRRYLSNAYRTALRMVGTPIRIECKESTNPFEGRRNKLTPGQLRKRKLMIKRVKK